MLHQAAIVQRRAKWERETAEKRRTGRCLMFKREKGLSTEGKKEKGSREQSEAEIYTDSERKKLGKGTEQSGREKNEDARMNAVVEHWALALARRREGKVRKQRK